MVKWFMALLSLEPWYIENRKWISRLFIISISYYLTEIAKNWQSPTIPTNVLSEILTSQQRSRKRCEMPFHHLSRASFMNLHVLPDCFRFLWLRRTSKPIIVRPLPASANNAPGPYGTTKTGCGTTSVRWRAGSRYVEGYEDHLAA